MYNQNGKDSTGISNGEMHSLFADRQGYIWVGTTAGLDKLNPQTGAVVHYKLLLPKSNSPFIGYIYNINQDKDDNIWVSSDMGFFIVDYKTGHYTYNDGTNGNDQLRIYYDINPGGSVATKTGIWFNVKRTGLMFYDHASKQFFSRYNNPQKKSIFECGRGNNSDMYRDDNNNLYFISADTLLVKYNLASENIQKFPFHRPADCWSWCQSLCADKKGNIWIGFRHGGVIVFDSARQTFRAIRKTPNNSLLPSDYVVDIARDYLGNIWASTDEGAAIINTDDAVAAEIYLSDEPPIQQMKHETGLISIDEKQQIYIPLFNNQLFVYNTVEPEMRMFHKPGVFDGSFVLAEKEQLLLAEDFGLHPMSLANGMATIKKANTTLNNLTIKDSINIVWAYRTTDNNYIVKKSSGFLYYYKANQLVQTFRNPGYMKQCCISQDEERLWYISEDQNLVQFNLQTLQADTILLNQLLMPTGFLFSNPRDLLEDASGCVWITSQNGLLCYNTKVKKINSYTIANGLSHGFSFALNTDDQDRLWVASLGGIDYFDRAKNVFRNAYASGSGKYMEAFGSSVKTKTGDIYFLFGNRLVKIVPSMLAKTTTAQEKIYWNEIRVNGVPISLPGATSTSIPQFAYNENRFDFKFGLLDFVHTDKITYSYYLEGLDSTWIDIGNRSTLLFNAIPPGNYVLHVKAISPNGTEVNGGLDFAFFVGKPFWKTFPFLFTVALLAAFIIFRFIRWREKNIRAINEEKLKAQQLNAAQYKSKLELEQIINYFSTSLVNKNTVDDVLWDVAKNLIGRLGFEDCMMYTWNSDHTKMIQRAGYGPKDSIEDLQEHHFDVTYGQGMVGYVMQTKEPVLIADTSQDARYRIDDIARLSELTVPILYNDELIGVIDSEHHEKNFYTQQHLQVLSTIASLIANKIKAIEWEQSLQQAKIDMMGINEKLSEAKLEALRSQMNPHFIFNSLNAIQECILTNKVDAAYSYLSQFSRLQRMVLHNSEKEFIPLSNEIEMLKLYLSLEALRFSQSFSYTINVQQEIDADEVMVPSMLLQPYVENAIWHGLRNKTGDKILSVHCTENEHDLVLTIEDNGIGRANAAAIKAQKIGSAQTESRGTVLSAERIDILALKYKAAITLAVEDKLDVNNEPAGTKVTIQFPLDLEPVKS